MAILFKDLAKFDELHNCQINVRVYEEREFLNSSEVSWLSHQIWIRDNYLCQLQPKNCAPQLFEFRVPQNCLLEKRKLTRDFNKKQIHFFPDHKLMTFVETKFDHFGNLILLSLGEKSDQTMTTTQTICKTQIFGDSE